MTNMADSAESHHIIIVGAGFSGLCMAIKLREAGIEDFVILEKAAEVGGVWRENTYPGAACDVPTCLYSYSFEHNPEWSCRWAGQAQILDYIRSASKRYGIYDHIRFNTQLGSATWQEDAAQWLVTTTGGATLRCRHLISAVGQLHHPKLPDIPGISRFEGAAFHSANWDHSVDLNGKNIAVIGTGASAIQFIPELVDVAARVDVFQRSANWVMSKFDKPYSGRQKWLRAKLPLLSRWDRLLMWLKGELGLLPAMHGNRFVQAVIRHTTLSRLKREVRCSEKRAALTPDYPVGAKRILFTDNYYQAIDRDHVNLHTAAIIEITPNGIMYQGGHAGDIDVIVFGTGFITNPFLSDVTIRGRDGIELHQHWREGAHAYLGVSTANFPNFFMLYGPNTNLGHNSIIQMIEAQVGLIVTAIARLEALGKQRIEVEPAVEQDYDRELQQRLNNTIWTQAESWYRDGERITNNWPGGTLEYKRRTRNVDPAAFAIS